MNCSVSGEPLKVTISGAPASGKETQCALIFQKVSVYMIGNHSANILY